MERQETTKYDGPFHRAIDWTSTTNYFPGEIGHGWVHHLSVGSWHGFERDAVYMYIQPERTSKPIRYLNVNLQRGRYTVVVHISRWADRHPALQAGPALHALLEPFLDRLDAA